MPPHTDPSHPRTYRGRLAPSPTGYLHLGHARTFWTAQTRAQQHHGTLILRNDDLDASRSRPHFVAAMLEDLAWFGFQWHEGPDRGGPFAPYSQSERLPQYQAAFHRLQQQEAVYPCSCSRHDVLRALAAPHAGDDDPVYPGICRPPHSPKATGTRINWRFRVPDRTPIEFHDVACGPQRFVAGVDFGDFIVWRHDGLPAYHLACVVDDALMRVTEVVRGADLLRSTARQLLLYQALAWQAPAFCHCPLLTDERGVRLAKRHDALSLRTLRTQGATPDSLRSRW
ncbi:MAG TPA: tRNA glutamyl-Q(34) synthetase GluQRS [Verrucomicrobiota bacterium]|nr:tRNA glutamyl-Q(34) synthetase GluQRS [Verrucomicrobiota bacterium]HNU51245.1 tRNA glutamyl-Q(34) synthetase GluQRS [Verrucomicrobiota bacterium]